MTQTKQQLHVRILLSVTYYDRAHPLFEDEWGKDFLEESEEVAVRLCLLYLRQLHTAKDVESIRL